MRRLLLIMMYVVFLQTFAMADMIYTTFLPGDLYETSSGHRIAGGDYYGDAGIEVANSFTVSLPATVTGYRVGVLSNFGNDGYISLWSGNSEPTALIEGNMAFGPMAGSSSILSVLSATNPGLSPGTTYWVVMHGEDPMADPFVWNYSLMDGLTRIRRETDGDWSIPWVRGNAFEVQGEVIPEPASLLLLGTGLSALGLVVYRRKKK